MRVQILVRVSLIRVAHSFSTRTARPLYPISPLTLSRCSIKSFIGLDTLLEREDECVAQQEIEYVEAQVVIDLILSALMLLLMILITGLLG